MFANQDWKKITTKAAIGMPGIAFAVFFVLNLLVWEQRRYVFGLSQICQHTVLPLTLVTVQTDYGDCLSIHSPIHAQHGTDLFLRNHR